MPDIPCPQCGQLNEDQREVCWACCKLLKPQAPPPKQNPQGPFNVAGTTTMKININGKEYERLADVPEQFRSMIKDSFRRASQGQKSRIVVNGKEYERMEDVPEPFRSKLRDGVARASPAVPKPGDEPEQPTLLGALTIAAGYAAVAATFLALCAEWNAITRGHETYWKSFPDFIRKTSPSYNADPHIVPVCLAVLLSAWVFARTRSFQTGRRSVRGVDAAVMWSFALMGLVLAYEVGSGDLASSPLYNSNWDFSALYDLLGLVLLFWTREPGQRLALGPISFSLDLPSETLDFDPGGTVALPDKFRFEDNGMERRISWRWFSLRIIGALIFVSLWDSLAWFILYAALSSKAPLSDLAIPLLLAVFGGGMAYAVAAYLVNRTTIRVDAARVSVRHGPLPWSGTRDVLKDDITRVWSEKNGGECDEDTLFAPRITYGVMLLLKSGKTLKVAAGLLDPDQALFIEQQVRKT